LKKGSLTKRKWGEEVVRGFREGKKLEDSILLGRPHLRKKKKVQEPGGGKESIGGLFA